MAKILSVSVKAGVTRLFTPLGQGLLRAGVTPNMVTVAGTAGVMVGALGFATRGQFLPAIVIITLSALTDVVDGLMARARGGENRFGALLDSTMDRVADGAVFGSLVWYYAGTGNRSALAAAIICLATVQLVSYVKARAEGLGFGCHVGLVERAERLITIGVGGLLTVAGLEWGLPAALWLVAVGSVVTVGQRAHHVWRADRELHGPGQPRQNGARG